jgi:hypothetical protein
MSHAVRATQEAVGENYDATMLLEARRRTWQVIHKVAEGVEPDMLEDDAVELARRVLADADMARGWHGLHIRFGDNTLKNYGEPSEPGTVLRDDDIFFIDIGPVWQKWEGDGGDTFVVGHDPVMHAAARDVKLLFDRVHARWRDDRLTGMALYEFAAAQAAAMGWALNLDMAGHRLSDFPHKAIHKGDLASAPYTPSIDCGCWKSRFAIPRVRSAHSTKT